MALIVAGIDEAGYGPLLGPMCVGMSVFRVEEGGVGEDGRVCLWERLGPQVGRPAGRGGKSAAAVLIGDSKKLKLANSAVRLHPLTHLERGVLSMLRSCGDGSGDGALVADDGELMARLGTELSGHECYGGAAIRLPLRTAGSWGLRRIRFRGRCRGVGFASRGCGAWRLGRKSSTRSRSREGSKAEVTVYALGVFLGELWRGFVGGG